MIHHVQEEKNSMFSTVFTASCKKKNIPPNLSHIEKGGKGSKQHFLLVLTDGLFLWGDLTDY